ncbi:MAG: hypothetical protein KatS3mg008_1283 [Acidimicrobiales bacterium]|nr:MAG: hypothetical protein KatS3mg008_1283 [Acidimicrobiales bacterium]
MTIIEGLDHVSTRVQDADAAFHFFHKTLGMEMAWPPNDYGPLRSAGLRLGNFNLEVVQVLEEDPDQPWPPQMISVRPVALAGLTVELDNRGLRFSEPQTVRGPVPPSGEEGDLWTSIRLHGRFAGACGVQVMRYHFDPTDTPVQDEPANRLGIRAVDHVWVGSTDPQSTIEVWQRLLVPVKFNGEFWEFDNGPKLRVTAAGEDCLMGLVTIVDSVEKAAGALEELGIHEESPDLLRTQGIGLAGVRFFLQDAPPLP